MFGKQARQIQADPTLDISKCKCCQCDEVQCKSCMEGHVISSDAGCCHRKNQALIFEYERPGYYGGGAECCRVPPQPCCPEDPPDGCDGFDPPGSPGQGCPPPQNCIRPDGSVLPPCSSIVPYVKRCCGTGKEAANNVKFYYRYAGQYYNIDYTSTGKYSKWPSNGMPRLCSWCDPTSLSEANPENDDFGSETCLDLLPPDAATDPRLDEKWPPEPNSLTIYTCSSYNGLEIFQNCKCPGYGDLADPGFDLGLQSTFQTKRLSRYRKRQMEQNPQYRWLLDIMCYDEGNVVAAPFYEYILAEGSSQDDDAMGQAIPRMNGGTLYNHLIGVVHCEHWYEYTFCDSNPEHNDPGNVLGGWIRDENGNIVGANTSNIAPRFWIYACSGVPIFDFEIERAKNTFDEFGQPFINESDYQHIIGQFALKKTPRQDVMQKLAKAGLFDIGDWRSEALNEIRTLRGLSYTASAYGVIEGYSGDEGACCFGASGDQSSSCVFTTEMSCEASGGNFFLGESCTSDLCVNCSGFKPHNLSNEYEKYLGPVRKKLYIPFNPAEIGPLGAQIGIGFRGITRPAFLDPRKARPNRWPEDASTFETRPLSAQGKERDFSVNPDPTLVDLQLPSDLLPMPWGDFTDPNYYTDPGNSFPPEPLSGESPSEEWKQFKKWRDAQWLYLHAKPGGWDYVCSGFQYTTEDGTVGIPEPRIPNLPRKFSDGCPGIGCCLDGLKGWPQRTVEFNGGCPDIACGYIDEDGNQQQAPQVGCEYESPCFGLDCIDDFWCFDHPEQGGGLAPCRNVAYSSDCNGIRFTYYRHRQINGDGINPEDYTTCNGSVKSWLYRVNIDTGNYGDFCPHTCRNLSVPRPIVDSLPVVQSNRLAAASLCEQYLQGDSRGKMCDGLYCLDNPIVEYQGGIPVPPYYGPGPFQSHCCGGGRGAERVDGPIPTDPTHRAANTTLCPFYPGPGCSSPTCRFYDGRFVGQYFNLNPSGCCWKCQLGVDGGVRPDTFEGYNKTLLECQQLQPEDIQKLDNYSSNGRGFIPYDQIGSESGCGEIWAGNCACGTNSFPPIYLPPLSTGEFCEPPNLGSDDIPTGDDNY